MGLILQCLFSPAISLHVFVYVVVLLELVLEQIKRRSAFGNRRCSSKISSSRSEAAVAGFLLVSWASRGCSVLTSRCTIAVADVRVHCNEGGNGVNVCQKRR